MRKGHDCELPTAPGERKMLAVTPFHLDVCLLHAHAMLAQASRKVIVSVDRC